MAELWDIYDKHRNKTGRFAERGNYRFKEGEYHLIVAALIINSKNEILMTKRATTKKNEPLKWEFTGGAVVAGETSLQAMLREIYEEIGLKFKPEDAIYLMEKRKDKIPSNFKDIWLFKKDLKIEDIKFLDEEAIDAKWVTIEELLQMENNKETISTIDFGMEEYKSAIILSISENRR